MSDLVVLPAEVVRWLRRLAAAREDGDGWVAEASCGNLDELVLLGVVERRPEAFRLTDLGWWVLARTVAEGDT